MNSLAKQRASIAAAAAALALGAGALYASADSGNDRTEAAPLATPAATPSDGLASTDSYAAYTRSDQRATARVREMVDVLNHDQDINPSAIRGVTTDDGRQAWIIPARDGLCFGAADDDGLVGYTCGSAASIAKNPTLMSAADTDGSVRAVFLVPDETVALEAGGKRFTPTNNTVTASYQRGATITRVDRDGTRTALQG